MKASNFIPSFKTLLIGAFLIGFQYTSKAQSIINVSSISALQTAITNSNSGDTIILANGTYLNNVINCNKNNITIKAASPGGVFLNGTNEIYLSGNYTTFSGFQFTSGNIGTNYLIIVSGSHTLLSQLNFSGYSAKKYIQINANPELKNESH